MSNTTWENSNYNHDTMTLDNIVRKEPLAKRIRRGAYNTIGGVLLGFGALGLTACSNPFSSSTSSGNDTEQTENGNGDNGNGDNGNGDDPYDLPSIELSVINDGSILGAFVLDYEKGDHSIDRVEYKVPFKDTPKQDVGWQDYDGNFSIHTLRLNEGDYVFKGRVVDDAGNVKKTSLDVNIDMPPDRTPPLTTKVEKMETGIAYGEIKLDDIIVAGDDRRFEDEEWVSGIKEASVYVAPIDSLPRGSDAGDYLREHGTRLDTYYSVTGTPNDYHTIETQLNNADADYHVYTLSVDNALNEWVHYNGKVRSGGPTQMGHLIFGSIGEQGTVKAYAVKGDFEMRLGEYETNADGDFMAEVNNYMEGETFELRYGGNSLQFDYETGKMDEDVEL